jgi:hypothetical protein
VLRHDAQLACSWSESNPIVILPIDQQKAMDEILDVLVGIGGANGAPAWGSGHMSTLDDESTPTSAANAGSSPTLTLRQQSHPRIAIANWLGSPSTGHVGNAADDGTTAGNVSSSAELVYEEENPGPTPEAPASRTPASQRNMAHAQRAKGKETARQLLYVW